MKITFAFFLLIRVFWGGGGLSLPVVPALTMSRDTIPSFLAGNFRDDYDIAYTITDSLWIQLPGTRYHILRINRKEQYIVARNDGKNPSEAGLYTRIDYLRFENMPPYSWGFCLSVYNAANDSLAEYTAQVDRKNPKKGCNGFPFSRMRKN